MYLSNPNSKRTFKYLLLLIILFLVTDISAQYYNVKFRKIGIPQGLSNNHINDILQDEYDYVWIATEKGLNRHDGSAIINIPLPTDSSKNSYDSKILDLEINLDGGLWALTDSHLFSYNNEQFKKVELPEHTGFKINSITTTGNSNWLLTNEGIYRYNRLNQRFKKYNIALNTDFKYSFINNTDIQAILLNSYSNELWVATSNKGIYIKDLETNIVRPYLLRQNEGRSRNNIFINRIIRDNYNTIWFASPEGLWCKFADNLSSKQIDLPETDFPNEVISIELGDEAKLWCSVSDVGLVVLDRYGNIIDLFDAEDHNKSGLSSGYINKILFDRHTNIWIGHQEFGINFFSADYSQIISYYKNVKNLESYLPTPVKRIFPLENQDVLLAYESSDNPIVSGLSILPCLDSSLRSEPAKIKQVVLNQSDLDITDVFTLNKEFVVSTYANNYRFNINELNTNANSIHIRPKKTIYDEYVMFHYLHNNKYYVLGEHLRIFNPHTQEDKLFIPDLNLDRFIIDNHGLLWGAASNSGLVIIDLEEKKPLAHYINDPLNHKTLSDNTINCIFKDSNGDFWFGTEFGLNKLDINIDSLLKTSNTSTLIKLIDTLSFKRFKTTDGLSNNSIKSILEDDQKRLWLTTNEGISVLNLLDHKIYKLGTDEGIQEGAFIVNSCAKSANGTLYFGGENGLNFLNPKDVNFKSKEYKLHINELYVNNVKIKAGATVNDKVLLKTNLEETDRIHLDYQDKLIQLGFVAVDFKHADAIEYYHKLEGFDVDWIKISEGNKAQYTKLPPGEYTFKVKAKTIDNHWTEKSNLKLIISPPYWASWWFIGLASLLLIGLIIVYIRYRLSHLKRQKQKLEKIVHSRTEDLEEANEELEEQKNEILKQRNQLFELNKEIKEANAQKIRFFTNISHELRTPLTLILPPLEKLMKTNGIASPIQEKHALIHRNAKRLQELINQLLQFRKIETGNLQLQARKGNIVRFLSILAEQFQEYAEQAGLCFEFITDTEVFNTWFDDDKLDKIVSNLLSNACKYTPEGGKISLEVICKPLDGNHHTKICVRDSGIGIAPEDISRIFDRFYESKEAVSRTEGSGIGLSLTQSLVILHKGEISVESQVGKGSCFTVKLPQGKDYLEETEISNQEDQPHEYVPDCLKKLSQTNRKFSSANYVQDCDKKTLLIVEDNIDLCYFLEDLLSEEYNVITAHNGQEGLSKLQSEDRINLIISDVMMPIMDGLSFCKHIKEDIETSHLPVLLLTAKHGEESEIEGLKTGADDYITKPFSEEILKTKLRNIFSYREKLRIKFSKGLSIDPSDITTTSRDEEFIKKAIEVVEANISESEFDIKGFASAMAVSQSTLLRKLKAITGSPSDQFIRSIRLKRAAQFLVKNQYTVTETCYEVGFTSQKHFSTTFKKQFGMTPSEYKKSYVEMANLSK